MGSRAVVVVCRDEDAARGASACRRRARRLSTRAPAGASSTTPTLRARRCLDRVARRSTAAGLWDELETDWLLPRLRADALVGQGAGAAAAPVRRRSGAAARVGARATAVAALERPRPRGVDVGDAAAAASRERRPTRGRYVEAYRRYCWPVASLDDLRLAPFHLLASEGAVHADKDHVWHMEHARPASAEPDAALLPATPHRVVDATDAASQAAGDRVVGGAHRARRRGDGRQAARLRRPRAAQGSSSRRSSAAAASTCGSSTARSTPRRPTSSGCASAASGASGRWPCASSPSASRRSSASSAASRCGACTSASSACSRWRASRWTAPL